MAVPGDELAGRAGGRGHLRSSHADREQVIGVLKAAFVQGMLAKDEFDLRVGQVLASRTYAELAVVTADLPVGLAAVQPPKPALAKGGQPILRPGQIATGATMLYAGAWVAAVFSSVGLVAVLLFGPLYLGLLAVAIAVALENRQERRSGRRPPRGQAPGGGGQALRRLPPASPRRQLPSADPGHRPTARAVLRRRPWPSAPVRGHWAGDAVLAAGMAPASG
ncbi:MAG TPA: DUF1707 domain-containing protein [Streptosporangiaceae bacterium]|nr:DUF1707 domain-containing protein [Streptosporangiaceae bacterium]